MDGVEFVAAIDAIVSHTVRRLQRDVSDSPTTAQDIIELTANEVVRDVMAALDGTKAVSPMGELGHLRLWYETGGERTLVNDFDLVSLEDEWAQR